MHQPNLVWTKLEFVADGGMRPLLGNELEEAEFVYIDARFGNSGNAPAGLFSVKVTLDGNLVGEFDFDKVNPGAEVRVPQRGLLRIQVPAPGPHRLDLLLDSQQDLNETSRDDDAATLTFTKRYLARDGGQIMANSSSQTDAGSNLLRIVVDKDAMPPDQVLITLHTPTWMNWRKESVITDAHNSDATMFTQDDRRSDGHAFPLSKLAGARLGFRKAGFLGQMGNDFGFMDLTHAVPGSRVRVIWLNDGTHSDPGIYASSADAYAKLLSRDGGFDSGAGYVQVKVEPGVVPDDEVRFSLVVPGTWYKEIQLWETPAMGGAHVQLIGVDHKHEAEDGLYTSQLRGGYLFLKAAKMFGIITDLCVIDATEAIPGSRITFTWTG